MADKKLVVIFTGAKQTVKAERAVKEAGFDARSIPTPLWLSLNCGIVLLINDWDKDAILKLCGEFLLDHCN